MKDKRKILLEDGINYMLVMKMTEEEIDKALSYKDYEDYKNYMDFLAKKYDI